MELDLPVCGLPFFFFPARNNETCSAGQDLSDEQLRDVAQTLGQEWEQAALHLGLKKEDLDEIKKEKREFMQRRNMLVQWKRRRPGKVTAQDLLRGLEDMKNLPVETRLLLKGNVLHPHTVNVFHARALIYGTLANERTFVELCVGLVGYLHNKKYQYIHK